MSASYYLYSSQPTLDERRYKERMAELDREFYPSQRGAQTTILEPIRKVPEPDPDAEILEQAEKCNPGVVQMLMKKNQELRTANARLQAEVTKFTERAQAATEAQFRVEHIQAMRERTRAKVELAMARGGQVKAHTDEECQTIYDLRRALAVAEANAEYARSQTAGLSSKFEAEVQKRAKMMQPSYDAALLGRDMELSRLARRNQELEERVKELEAQLSNGSSNVL